MKLPIVRRSTLEALLLKLQAAEAEVARLAENYDEARKEAEASHAAIAGDRDRVSAQLSRARAEGERANALLAQMQDAVKALESTRTELLAELSAVREEAQRALAQALAQVRSAQDEASKLSAEHAHLIADKAATSTETSRLNADLRQRTQETHDLEQARRAAEQIAAERDRQLIRISAELTGASEQLAAAQTAQRAAESAVANLNGRLDTLLHEFKWSQSEVGRLGAENVRMDHELRALKLDAMTAANEQAVRLNTAVSENARLAAETLRLEALRPPESLTRFANRQDAIVTLRTNGARARLLAALALSPQGQKDRKAVFALHKTASMFVWHLLDMTSDVIGVELHSPNGFDAEYVLDEISLKRSTVDWSGQYGVFGPFRGHVALDRSLFSRFVVITRDPRDLLVSMYYSWSRSHPVSDTTPTLVSPAGELFSPSPEERQRWIEDGPDRFVLEYADFVEGNLRAMQDLASNANAVLLRYEDFIASPHDWIRRFFGALGCDAEDIAEYMPFVLREFGAEFIPPREDAAAHRRQMLPGDYQRKLKDETIASLTKKFAFYFEDVRVRG